MSNEELQKFLEKYQIACPDQDRETFLNKVMKELRKVIDSGEYFDTDNYRAMSGMADWGMTLADLRVAIREELGLPYQTTIWMYNGAAYSWSSEAETAPMPVP